MTKKKDLAVFIAGKLDTSEKTQTEIAAEVGFEHPNVLSMIKSGATQIPIGRVPALADALEIPRDELLRRCLDAYLPELYAILAMVLPGTMFNDEQVEMVRMVEAARRVMAAAPGVGRPRGSVPKPGKR